MTWHLEINQIDESYTKILRKYDKESGNSNSKKAITKATDAIGKSQDDADTLWDDTKTKITEIEKKQKKEQQQK